MSTRRFLRDRARELRHQATDAEKRLWFLLRSRSLARYKFRRQHIIGRFIADFCCLEKRLVIELDGSQHAEQTDKDSERAQEMARLDFQTLRFWNDDVLRCPNDVAEKILNTLETIQRHATERKVTIYGWRPSPQPSPSAGRG